jgi:hypothetical protein
MNFVVLHHTGWPGHADHYDLMLQIDPGKNDDDLVLRTFSTLSDAFPAPPAVLKENIRHRRAYLKYEGPVSENRGTVTRADEGEVRVIDGSVQSRIMQLEFFGSRLSGLCCLRSTDGEIFSFERVP